MFCKYHIICMLLSEHTYIIIQDRKSFMKKSILNLVSGLALLAGISSAFAADVTCPSVDVLRQSVTFERAARFDEPSNKPLFVWGLTSNTFKHSNTDWNAIL